MKRRTMTRAEKTRRNRRRSIGKLCKKYMILWEDAENWFDKGIPLEVRRDKAYCPVQRAYIIRG